MDQFNEFAGAPSKGKAREMLLKRLIGIVSMPASSIAPQDRAMAGDILLDMMFHADTEERVMCANRLSRTREAPRRLMRYLAQCAFEISEPLLLENESFDASDLRQIIAETSQEHHLAIAKRKHVPATVCDALIATGEPHTARTLLANKGAMLSEYSLDELVLLSRKYEELTAVIVGRLELAPSQAMAMFWWADGATRRVILQRHAADRLEMIDACSEVFAVAAEEGWSDPVARKTLQLIERRQRNRAAIEHSQFESLENAVQVAAGQGMDGELAQEIGHLSGVKPVTIAKILSDRGGEGLAVLCKATGLKRQYLRELWVALKRPLEIDDGEPHPQFAYVSETYELLSVAKAQTTLRYWNWSLSSSFSQKSVAADDLGEDAANDQEQFSTSQRTARLVFGAS